VLIVVNPSKERYEAILGVMSDGILRILCNYQYHAPEIGWHCHASCGDIAGIPVGFMRGPWVRRIPKPKSTHKRLDFGISDGSVDARRDVATKLAIDRYRIEAQGSLL
jgi:hypothetical protein